MGKKEKPSNKIISFSPLLGWGISEEIKRTDFDDVQADVAAILDDVWREGKGMKGEDIESIVITIDRIEGEFVIQFYEKEE